MYREEEVRFRNGDVELAGRLLVLEGRGPHPVIVLVHGWGARTRNHVGAIVADVFARHGIAALVYDKRGTGGSEGDWRQTSIAPEVVSPNGLLFSSKSHAIFEACLTDQRRTLTTETRTKSLLMSSDVVPPMSSGTPT